MARKSHKSGHKRAGRGRRGGALPPLQAGAYPAVEDGGSMWNTSVSGGGTPAAASSFKSLLSQPEYNTPNPLQNSMALNRFALQGMGQGGAQGGGQAGGGSRRKRRCKMGSRSRRGGAMNAASSAPAPAAGAMSAGSHTKPTPTAPNAKMMSSAAAAMNAGAGKAQKGGMFATFGALLKEALVPLGLLAAQQTYGKTYGKKHRGHGSHTRKHRR